VLSVVLAGDYIDNGVVDTADYIVWRKTVGPDRSRLHGADASGNGLVDSGDFDIWRSHFGQMAGSGAAIPSANPLSAAAPEPATLVLLIMAIAGMSLGRRSKSLAVSNSFARETRHKSAILVRRPMLKTAGFTAHLLARTARPRGS
jgi:hypothetical protein